MQWYYLTWCLPSLLALLNLNVMFSNVKCRLLWVISAGALVLVVSCKKTMTPVRRGLYRDSQYLFSLISNNFNLSHFDTALLYSGLDTVLSQKGSFAAFVVQ